MPNLKNISDLPVAESTEGLNLVAELNGSAQRIPANSIGGGASSWNDLADKPFGSEVTEGVIEFDGDLTGKEVADGDFSKLVKMTDKIFDIQDFVGATVVFLNDGVKCEQVLTENDVQFVELGDGMTMLGVVYLGGNEMLSISSNSGTVQIGLPEGTVFAYGDENNYVISISCLTGSVETIDEKYLPDSVKGGGGGSFVLHPTAEELTGDKSEILCTTNYDEMAKALEAGANVCVVIPESFDLTGMGFKVSVSLLSWAYVTVDGQTGITARFVNFASVPSDTLGVIMFTNGTYVPTM